MAVATELKEVEVQFVSYVEEGANKKKFFLIKDKNKKEPNVETKVKVLINKEDKNKDEPHLIYGVVYEPLVVDTDGDFMREKEIRKTAHNFLKNYRLVDKDHNNIPGAGEVVESYVLLDDMEQGDETIKKGSWVLVTQPDDETWELIKDGKYSGYSLFGYAKEKIDDVEVKNNTSTGIWDSVKKVFGIKKDFTTELENYRNNDFWYLFEIFQNAIWKIDWNVEGKEYKEKILNNLNQLTEEIKNMTFETQESAVEKSKTIVGKPYPNEHACRLKDPDNYDEFSRKTREHGSKEYSVIYGIKDNEEGSEEQSYRYDTDEWSAAEAREHCKDHDGNFHEAENKNKKNNSQGEVMDEELKKEVKTLVEEVMANTIKNSKETKDKDNKDNEENEMNNTTKELSEKIKVLTEKVDNLEKSKEDNDENEKIDIEKLEKSLTEARERLDGVEEAMTNIPEYKVEKENDKEDENEDKNIDFKFSKMV